jgi:hypothetical protein
MGSLEVGMREEDERTMKGRGRRIVRGAIGGQWLCSDCQLYCSH